MKRDIPEHKKKKSTIKSPFVAPVTKILRKHGLHSVCESAHCPNIGDCFKNGTATFLILGVTCTRNCRFCNISTEQNPLPPDPKEPAQLADAVAELGLSYVVVTSVTRDDLPDGGAQHFSNVIAELRVKNPFVLVEVLTPDFQNNPLSLEIVGKAVPDVFNHNVETVPRLYSKVRPEADYQQSLTVLRTMKEKYKLITKSGIMTGVGETMDEMKQLMRDVRAVKCDIFTIGQYFRPSHEHLPVEKDYTEEEFEELREYGLSIGFSEVHAGRFVRSSFNAHEIREQALERGIGE